MEEAAGVGVFNAHLTSSSLIDSMDFLTWYIAMPAEALLPPVREMHFRMSSIALLSQQNPATTDHRNDPAMASANSL